MNTIQFLGAAKTVTGSKHLLTVNGKKIFIDCGLFQGLKELRLKNWESLAVNPGEIDVCIITHAHIDHTGYLPRFVKDGFKGKIYCTHPTFDLLKIMLLDSAHLQEEEAEYANKKGYSKHTPAVPLYTTEDAQAVFGHINPLNYNEEVKLEENLSFKLLDAGHLLGSSIVKIRFNADSAEETISFTGDIGRFSDPLSILNTPSVINKTDYLVMESTYGNRAHSIEPAETALKNAINDTFKRGGVVVIPSFTVGRTQEILFTIRTLQDKNDIPDCKVFVDSPMAINATEIYLQHTDDQNLFMQKFLSTHGKSPIICKNLTFTKTSQESKGINSVRSRAIIISADGMATNGRITHHLYNRISNPVNSVVFVGYQALGTRGRDILDGKKEVKLFGETVPVRAKIINIDNFSSHGDYEEILHWLKNFEAPPKKTFLVHGEQSALEGLKEKIEKNFRWDIYIPGMSDIVNLD